MKPLKLTVEPVPVTSAGKSLSCLLPKHRWDKIRQKVYAESGYRCTICGVRRGEKHPLEPRPQPEKKPERSMLHRALFGSDEPLKPRPKKHLLECHEVWEYDEASHVQRLAGFMALCSPCHHVKHWPCVGAVVVNGKLRKGAPPYDCQDEVRLARLRALRPDRYLLEDHFMWVNGCDLKTLIEHVEEAAEMCFHRSQIEWRVDFGGFGG